MRSNNLNHALLYLYNISFELINVNTYDIYVQILELFTQFKQSLLTPCSMLCINVSKVEYVLYVLNMKLLVQLREKAALLQLELDICPLQEQEQYITGVVIIYIPLFSYTAYIPSPLFLPLTVTPITRNFLLYSPSPTFIRVKGREKVDTYIRGWGNGK